ncbi:unnamed protein product [Urochloa humidicola]
MSHRRPAARRLTLAPTPVPRGASDDEEVHWVVNELAADSLEGQRTRICSSRFWALAEDLSSDEDEDEEDVQHTPFRVQPGRPTAVPICTTSNTPVTQPSAAELTPNRCLVSSVAGSTHASKEEASGHWTDVTSQGKKGPKPWRGPLPAARTSPQFTLADALARARRSTTKSRRNSKCSGGDPARKSAPSPAPTSESPTDSQNSIFESR